MKKIVFALIAALAAPLAAQAANGAYIGANAGRAEQKADVEGIIIKDRSSAFKIYGGYNFDQHFGVEGGYIDTKEGGISGNGARVGSDPRAVYAAATGTLPLNQQFSLFAKVGAARNHVKVTASFDGYSASGSANRTSAYVSVGAAYAVNANVSFVAEYENFGKILKEDGSSVKANIYSVGLRYAF